MRSARLSFPPSRERWCTRDERQRCSLEDSAIRQYAIVKADERSVKAGVVQLVNAILN